MFKTAFSGDCFLSASSELFLYHWEVVIAKWMGGKRQLWSSMVLSVMCVWKIYVLIKEALIEFSDRKLFWSLAHVLHILWSKVSFSYGSWKLKTGTEKGKKKTLSQKEITCILWHKGRRQDLVTNNSCSRNGFQYIFFYSGTSFIWTKICREHSYIPTTD